MKRTLFGCMLGVGLSLAVGVALAAPNVPATYAGSLLADLTRAMPQIQSATISAVTPKAHDANVVASTNQSLIGKPADPADVAAGAKADATIEAGSDKLEVRLALHDVSGDPVGSLHLSYAYHLGDDRAAIQRSAEQARDRLSRRISNAGNLSDPFPYEPDAPAATYAQTLVDEFLDKHREIQILAIHVTPPDSDYNIIAGSNIGRIGKKADNDDMRCVFTGKPNLEVNSTGKRFETEMQLHDRAGHVIGAVGVVVAYKSGDDKQALHAQAEKVKADLEKRIPDAATLFRPSG